LEDELSVGHLLLNEYKKLKDEQLARIGTRDNLIYVTLASLAAVIAATLQADASQFLLLIPPICLVLGWTYLVNDEKISAIGRHIRNVLAPQLGDVLRTDVSIFTWEIQHRSDRFRLWRKAGQLAIDLVTFCLPPVVAVGLFWLGGARPVALLVTAAVELLAVLGLGLAIVVNADLTRDRPLYPEPDRRGT
jgi:hypothetical protein